MKTVLIVDGDLGFVAFLWKSLSQAGYAALPATGSQPAIRLLEEVENPKVDLLIVNLALRVADDLIPLLKKQNQSLKIIAVEDPRQSAGINVPVDDSLRRPSSYELAAGDEWLVTVRGVLTDKPE